jgi:hypothetical protein
MNYATLTTIFDKLATGDTHLAIINCLQHYRPGMSYNQVATLFRDRLTIDVQAAILNLTLAADQNTVDDGADGWLTDDEADIAATLFDACIEIFDESTVELAQAT